MALYSTGIFLGAFLLFLVQPLIGRYILPWFGGSPSVWTVCMLFFQVLLLAGYAWVHGTSRWVSLRTQAVLQLALLCVAVASLPATPDGRWLEVLAEQPTLQILLLLGSSLGFVYFTLATTGPLLQRWYSLQHGHAPPYRLFALSNTGSLLALLAYPFVIEPTLTRETQSELWSWTAGLFALLFAVCALQVLRSGSDGEQSPDAEPTRPEARPGPREVLLWLALPTVASVMFLATTNKLCEEIAVIPFLWVLPLALYLFSFVLAFDHPRWYHRGVFGVALILGAAEYDTLFARVLPIVPSIAVLSALLFTICMICHGELYRLRPDPRHLTAFYLMTALGGALGGVIVALVAPTIWPYYEEFEFGLIACAALLLLVNFFDPGSPLYRGRERASWGLLLITTLGVSGYLVSGVLEERQRFVHAERSFHGSLYIQEPRDPAAPRALWSGSTTHGMQLRRPDQRMLPTSYYARESGVGLAIDVARTREAQHVGVVGLGVGTLAAYGRPGDRMRFYELDPRVAAIAREHFSFLEGSRSEVEVVLGDARLSLESEPPQDFDVLVLDAFTGDAVPVHLLTLEAFELYARHLAPEGVIAVHISNRHIDLRPVVLAAARRLGFSSVSIETKPAASRAVDGSHWLLLTRNRDFLGDPRLLRASSPLDEAGVEPLIWTDEWSSLFRVLK